MQGLVHGRQSVRAYPKVRSDHGALELSFRHGNDTSVGGVTQEWVDEGELPRERTNNRRWQRPYDVLAEATRGEVVVRMKALVVSIWGLCMIRAAGELDYFSDHIRLREPGKSEDKAK
ncbi:hypothetical protein BHM03_00032037 [Ensete ventricosum]|nr:hypothetical protein BHM03_00032037 [Ensete ventricosum]